MSTEYQNNHYVPVWYQKQFIPLGQTKQELYYLDMKPGEFVIPGKGRQKRSGLRKWGPKRCFSELELYTRHFGVVESTAIEQQFFGPIDDNGKKGVEYFANFVWQSVDYDAFYSMIFYMSTQKLRTPKGLGWLSDQTGASGNDDILNQMIQFRDIFSAIWGECVWPIADAKQSDTKFIISDHPVTVYNRRCGPRSQWCRGFNDPDIRYFCSKLQTILDSLSFKATQ